MKTRTLVNAALFTLHFSLFTLTAGAVSFVYRGAISDDYGLALTPGNDHTVVFRLYRESAGSTADALVTLTNENVAIDAHGAFQRTLDLSAFEDLLGSGALNYVGISVDGSEEIAPRQAMLPHPYANRAKTADRIGAGGAVANVTAGDVECRTLKGGTNVVVAVTDALAVERRDGDDAPLVLDLEAGTLNVRANGGMTVFRDGWRPLDATWWSGNWSSLKRGQAPVNGSLAVGYDGAYFISSLGECAGEDAAAGEYAQLLNVRNTIWRMPGVTFLGRRGDRIDDAYDKIFKPVCVDVGRNTDNLVPPQVKAAYLPYVGDEGGAK